MPLALMILRRLFWIIPVALGVVTITFFAARVFTGDPTELYTPPEATDELRAQIRERLGLADPLWVQYGKYLSDLLRGDFGMSFTTGLNVGADLSDRLPATLELGLVGMVFGVLAGVPLGVIAAVNRERWPDFLVRGVTLGGMALPQFWIGLVLIWIFFVTLGWLPGPVGRLPIGVNPPPLLTGFLLIDTALAGDGEKFRLALRQLALPALTLGLTTLAPVARVTRASMVEALQSDYIRTAIAMGHGRRVVWFRYCLRNALLPVVTLIGGVAGHVFGGAVLLESIFGWPGLGQYALQAIERSDFAALQGFVIYASLLYVLAFLAVDVLYMLIDPRMRTP
ncbi:peptide/nickel transport system permease protein [Humitalea rosea]|uniref:Peptide/nickel transport system permease protein n=1 Tax=Humitalea rosea TaxID=990373 RepID=A0A2W7ILJ3_9PROT|nr:ABC transporter permease [Humitalea rosea]PZW39443.1 peptide/nickel transport system permease protein [Humitalea rosea]